MGKEKVSPFGVQRKKGWALIYIWVGTFGGTQKGFKKEPKGNWVKFLLKKVWGRRKKGGWELLGL